MRVVSGEKVTGGQRKEAARYEERKGTTAIAVYRGVLFLIDLEIRQPVRGNVPAIAGDFNKPDALGIVIVDGFSIKHKSRANIPPLHIAGEMQHSADICFANRTLHFNDFRFPFLADDPQACNGKLITPFSIGKILTKNRYIDGDSIQSPLKHR